jgi:CHAT domain-containing protein/Tfp pilus assembly protein PilF
MIRADPASSLAWFGHQHSFDHFDLALKIRREMGNRRSEAVTLNNIGVIHSALGEKQRALEYYLQSHRIKQELGDRRDQPPTLNNIGSIYRDLGDYQKSLDYYGQAISLFREFGDREGEARVLGNLARAHRAAGDRRKSIEALSQSLQLSRAVGSRLVEATSLAYQADVYMESREDEKAFDGYQQALALARSLGDRRQEASMLQGLARFERRRGNLKEACTLSESALSVFESLRAAVANQSLRSSYFETVRNRYEFHIDLVMQLHRLDPTAGHDAIALQASERARARGLIELLTEARAEIRQGVEKEMLDREQALQQQLNAKSDIVLRLKSNKRTERQAMELEKEIDALTTDLQNVQTEIRRKSPRYAAIAQPIPLTLAEIQDQLLDPGTLLLEYSLGEERSYLWSVTPETIESHELPKRATIKDAAEKFLAVLSMPRGRRTGETSRRQRQRIAELDAQTQARAMELSQMLLAPVAARLGKKRLVIVADGALQYVPFAVLPKPDAAAQPGGAKGKRGNNGTPLIADHEIVSLPSASTLAVLRRDLEGRAPAPKMVRAFADPVFDACDDRFVEREKCLAQNNAPAQLAPVDASAQTRAIQSLRDANVIRRLRGSKEEAEFIASLTPPGSSKVSHGFEANLTSVTSQDAGQYRYVHFATHGWLDDKRPDLTGVLLSLVDEQGREQNGLLRLGEVYNLRLPAEVVTLSACQTALGKDVRGEGLVGLTRGFMYAGAARVAASLWKVEEEGTKELMTSFYSGMLGKKPLRPAAALRQAQLSMLRDPQWRSPYYWGAFILQGEWR